MNRNQFKHAMHLAFATIFASLCLVGATTDVTQEVGGEKIQVPFKVVQYNIFDRPTLVANDGQAARIQRLAATLAAEPSFKDADVITLCELDMDDDTTIVQSSLNAAFGGSWTVSHAPQTKPIHDAHFTFTNGGVRIATRLPVHALRQYVYEHTSSIFHEADELAAKGVIYARVEKQGRMFNVFATHMQAWYDPDATQARAAQAVELKNFINMQLFEINGSVQRIPVWEPVIIAGDLNDDLVRHPDDVIGLVEALQVEPPWTYMFRNADGTPMSDAELDTEGTVLYSSDPSRNVLVGADGACGGDPNFKVPSCKTEYMICIGANATDPHTRGCACNSALLYYEQPPCAKCASQSPNPQHFFFSDGRLRTQKGSGYCFCACCPHEWLDYVMYVKTNKVPAKIDLRAVRLKAGAPFDVEVENLRNRAIKDISDHFPVVASMVFEYDGAEPTVSILGAETSDAEGIDQGVPTCKALWYAPTCTCRNCNTYGTSCDLDNTCQYVGVPGLGGKCMAGFTSSYNIDACGPHATPTERDPSSDRTAVEPASDQPRARPDHPVLSLRGVKRIMESHHRQPEGPRTGGAEANGLSKVKAFLLDQFSRVYANSHVPLMPTKPYESEK